MMKRGSPGHAQKKDTDQVVFDLERGAMWFFLFAPAGFVFPLCFSVFSRTKKKIKRSAKGVYGLER